MPSLASRYPDLLPTLDDSALNRVVTSLDRAYGPDNPQVAMPPELRDKLGATLARRAVYAAAPSVPARRLRLPRSAGGRTGLAALLVAAMLGSAVIGLAVSAGSDGNPYLRNQGLYGYHDRLAHLMAQYGRSTNAAQHACGYAVTLRRVYADANRVNVAAEIQGPPGRTFIAVNGTGLPSLTDARGKKLRFLEGGIGDTFSGVNGMYASFDAHAIAGGPEPLHLRFSLPSFTLVEQLNGASFQAVSCEQYARTAYWVDLESASLPDRLRTIGARVLPFLFHSRIGRTVTVDHGYTIPFTVPLDAARTDLHPNQAVTAGGVTLILDRVLATRSETRVYLRRATPGHILENADAMLWVESGQYGSVPLFSDYWTRVAPASRRYDFAFGNTPYLLHVPYTLVVRRNPYASAPNQPWRLLQGGPWTFHFMLP